MINQQHAANLQQAFNGPIPHQISERCEGYVEVIERVTGQAREVPAEILALFVMEYLESRRTSSQVQQPPAPDTGFAFNSAPASTQPTQPTAPVVDDTPLQPSFITRQQQEQMQRAAYPMAPPQQPDAEAVNYEHMGQLNHKGEHPFQQIPQQGREPIPLTDGMLNQIVQSQQAVPAMFLNPEKGGLSNGLIVGREGAMAVVKTSDIDSQGFTLTKELRVAVDQIRV